MNSVLGHDSALEDLWIMPLVQDRLLNLLTSSPVHYHCATDAPPPKKK